MNNFELLWFNSLEEKQKAVEKAREILESVKMHPDGIKHFLNSEELVWSVCNDTETVANWENGKYNSPLSIEGEYHRLALVLTEMS